MVFIKHGLLLTAALALLVACNKEEQDAGTAAASATSTASPNAATSPQDAAIQGRGAGLFSVLAVPAAAADDEASPVPVDPTKIDVARIEKALRARFELPPEVQVRIDNVRPVSVPGLAAADLSLAARGQSESRMVFLSSDGRYVSPSPFYEIKANEAAPMAGFRTIRFTSTDGEETQKIYVSNDGSLVSFGELWDVTVDPDAARMEKISIEGTPTRGKTGAKVVVVEFSDFQCPYCARSQQMIQSQLYPEYKDKVEFRFKHLPLSFHNWARQAASASACVAEQDHAKFWKAYDYFFDNQRMIRKDNIEQKVREMGTRVGVDSGRFEECYKSGKYDAQIERDIAEANSVGISGTPAYLINGRKISGAQPFDAFKSVIDEKLAAAN